MVYAWGLGVHTLISFNLLDELRTCGSLLYPIVSNNFWEFLYGSLAPDFMVARKFVSIENNSHNLDFAYKLFDLAKNEKELSFALGYLSHLASDKIMHEQFLVDYKAFKITEHMSLELVCDAYYASYLQIAKLVLKKKSRLSDPLKANIGLAVNIFVGKKIAKLSTRKIALYLPKKKSVLQKIDKNIANAYITASIELSKNFLSKL